MDEYAKLSKSELLKILQKLQIMYQHYSSIGLYETAEQIENQMHFLNMELREREGPLAELNNSIIEIGFIRDEEEDDDEDDEDDEDDRI